MKKRLVALLLALLMTLASFTALADVITVNGYEYPVEASGWYDTMEEVAVYLEMYDELPENFLTKKEAQSMGWVSSKGNLWDVAYGCSIGGDRFGNYEGLLPDAKNRRWTECDIGFEGGRRGAARIVFSNDGLIYYTEDHYESFDQIEVVWEETDTLYFLDEEEEEGYSEYGAADMVVDLLEIFLKP